MPNHSQYTDYSPDYSSLNDLPTSEALRDDNPKARQRAEGRRVRARRKKEPEVQTKVNTPVEKPNRWRQVVGALTGTSARLLFGIFLGITGIYLLVSFMSYFVTCVEDQSLVNSLPVGQVLFKAQNAGGEGGARLSEFLINESFGLGSIVIVVWLLAISMKLLVGKPRFKTVNFTIKCLIVLITVSLIIGLVTISSHTPVNWGGYHGRYINEFIVGFAGWTGAALLSLFMLSVFAVICLHDFAVWIRGIYRKHKEKRRLEREAREEQEAKEAEILRMKQQEQIDDIRAGEATVIHPDPIVDVQDDDTQVDFSEHASPLYSMPDDLDDNPIESSFPAQPDETENPTDPTEYTETTVPAESAPSVPSDSSDSSDNSDISQSSQSTQPFQPSQPSDKMIVNVGTIGEAEQPKLRSEVSNWEARGYDFPPIDILYPAKSQVNVSQEEQLENKNKIEKTLLDFGIPITRIEATVGPTVTLYEIRLENGVKISKIRGLADDIALSLAASGVRIIAPIPGKGTVGIEVANKVQQTVSMRTVLNSKAYQETKYHLPIALGSTISNQVYLADLAKMPHLLVAGATGQGKSVGLNAIIASLMYSLAPWQLKFVMIDPKQVEFSLYNKIRDHYMAVIPEDIDNPEPVITDSQKVEAVLNSLVIEMENRYTLLKNAKVRNIEEYNAKIRACQLNLKEGHHFLPYIVVIVDEFGDLIMVSGRSVEMPIARLAQKARAVGMHVIIATQRPSANVITGIIKANFPSRISFKVSSGVDSRTILDAVGAQQLIGRGDMLISNNSEMVRVQCAFIDTPEVEAICDYVARQPYAQGPYLLPEPQLASGEDSATPGEFNGKERDPLFEEVAHMVVSKGQASTSAIQRVYSLGYNRAGRIMDQLEQAHIVGPSQGGKPRTILVDGIELESILDSLN